MHDQATLSFPPAENSPFPTLAKFHKDTHTSPPTPLLEDNVVSHDYPLTPSTLHKALSNSNGLFFIQYTPKDTFKSRWFLVQINNSETLQLQMDSETLVTIISLFYHAILPIILCAMTQHVGDHYGMNMF